MLFDTLIEDRIQTAMREGQFKNLPGEGKPLNLSEYDFLNPDAWAGNKILKNAGFVPPWVELAWEIERDEERLATVRAEYTAWLETIRAALAQLSPPRRDDPCRSTDAAFHRFLER